MIGLDAVGGLDIGSPAELYGLCSSTGQSCIRKSHTHSYRIPYVGDAMW